MQNDFLLPEKVFPFFKRQNIRSEMDFGFLWPLRPTIVFETYWRFAVERQRIFFRRIRDHFGPWTDDPILKHFKFTNAYRASDRVSQFLIRNVIYEGDCHTDEVFFRILLFKLFNRIETWTLLTTSLGELCWSTFKVARYDAVLSKAMNDGERIYSPAYIMPSGGPNFRFARKHQMHLGLLERMMKDKLPSVVARSGSMEQVFTLLKGYPSIGNFLAYQYATDLNYSKLIDFDEMSFVVPGPGAISGIRKCFYDVGGKTDKEVIMLVTKYQDDCFNLLEINFPNLWGRRLQLIDCQNLFCEVDKYARVKHPQVQGKEERVRIKQRFKPIGDRVKYFYPPKWDLSTENTSDSQYV